MFEDPLPCRADDIALELLIDTRQRSCPSSLVMQTPELAVDRCVVVVDAALQLSESLSDSSSPTSAVGDVASGLDRRLDARAGAHGTK